MNDDFLSRLAEPPRPEFVERLAERLRAIDEARSEAAQRGPWRRFVPALAGAGLVAALAVAFSLEPVRAAAVDFLDLFRVKRFAAVPVDPERFSRLQQGLDLESLVGDQLEIVVPPQKPVLVSSAEAGAIEAGVELRQPTALPRGYEPADVAVSRPGAFRVRIDTARLEELAAAVGAGEIEIPAAWNGATISVDMPPVLITRYRRPGDSGSDPAKQYVLFQSRNPEIALPEGVEPQALGELALRVAGLSQSDAERFSRAVDWRATLLVPVPVGGSTFREVEVNGATGLLVSARMGRGAKGGAAHGPHSVLMWATAEHVYAIHGPGASGLELVATAQSIR